jgi:hypothetical protein
MEIQPASIAQVRAGRGGRAILIEDDVLDIARRLQAIDESLRLRWNEQGEFFVIYQVLDDAEKLVLTAQELDERVLRRVREIAHPSYDYMAEVDRMDKQSRKDADHRFYEETGEVGERLAHAVRRDLQAQNKVFVSGKSNA